MDKPSLIFCILSLVVTLGGGALAVPLAQVSPEVMVQHSEPTPAEHLGQVDVGDGFGTLPVSELMYYYVDNPPTPAAENAPAAQPQRRFGGC